MLKAHKWRPYDDEIEDADFEEASDEWIETESFIGKGCTTDMVDERGELDESD